MSLLGTWVVDPTDIQAFAELGDVSPNFSEDGQLIYIIRSATKNEIIKLHYAVEGSTIITDQPSDHRVERTEFSLSGDGVLTLKRGGPHSLDHETQKLS